MASLRNVPAPIRGWNTVDSIAEIPPDMAIVLDNMIPSTASVISRKGYTAYATSVGSGNVDSLFELKAASVSKMIAAASGNIYDVTSSGAATLLKSGFTSNQWQGTVFNAQLALVNGLDTPQVYDGTTVAAMTVSGPSDVTLLNSVITYKFRTYFTLSGSQSFWYSALNTLGNVLTEFPLGKVGNFGGTLLGMQALTKDGGSGQDDSLCFFMSSGEIIVYQGTNPASDFVLTGVFYAGRPLNARAIVKFGADIVFVTNEGYLPVSSLLPLSYGKDNSTLNRYIKGAASDAAAAFPTNFGWQIVQAPAENIMLVNVPQTNNTFVQHVLNVNTMAWCRFTNMNARCWAVFGNTLFFGSTNGTIYQYGPDYIDNGSSITSVYQSPYLSLQPGQMQTTAFRPRVRLDGNLTMTVKTSYDFKPFSLPYTVSYSFIGAMWGDAWGTAWASTNSIINYLNLNTICYNVSVYLTFASGAAVDFFDADYLVKPSSRI